MKPYSVQYGQCLLDIAIECYGDQTGVFWLMDDNPDVREIADRLTPGQVLQIREGVAINQRVQSQLADFAPFATIEDIDLPTGIGYWPIGEFVIT